jgi:hexosaminidase
MDPTREEVYKFIDRFIGEMVALFPDGYMHIGGDENKGTHWDKNPKIQEFKKAKGSRPTRSCRAISTRGSYGY